MQYIEWIGNNFIGLFEAGADVFIDFMTGIIPLLVVLLTFTNAVVSFIGEDRVDRWIKKSSRFIVLRYTLMPILSILLLTNPMAYTFGQFVEEHEKPAFYDAAVSFIHPVTGLLPYANAGELFVYLGIADGVVEAGYSQGPLAVRYLITGIVVMLLRGIVTEFITKRMMVRETNSTETPSTTTNK